MEYLVRYLLDSSLDFFNKFFNSIEDLVFVMENKQNRFYYAFLNDAAKKVLKVGNEIIGKPLEEVILGDLQQDLNEKYRLAIETNSIITYEDRVQIHNSEFIGETKIYPIISENGKGQYVLAIVRDITERRKKEQSLNETKDQLEKNQKRLNSLIYNNHDLVFEMDLKGHFVMVNKVVLEVLCYDKKELINKHFSCFIVPEDWQTHEEIFLKSFEGQNTEFNAWFQKKNGEKVLLHVKNIPIIVNGTLDGVYGIAKDITKEFLAEKELRETKDELQLFWSHTVDPVFLFRKGEILKVNPAFEKTFGYSEKEINESPEKIIPEGSTNSEFKNLWHTISSGKEITLIEIKRKTKDGKILEFLASYTPVVDAKGEIVSATAFYKNISDYKRSERELQSSVEKFKVITENAFDMIFLVDFAFTIEYASPSTQEILGYDPSKLIGMKITNLIHPEDIQYLKEGISVSREDGQDAYILEVRAYHKNRKWIWTEGTMKAVKEDGKYRQIVIVARDISQKKLQRDMYERMAYYDYLTGLPNRRYFNEHLEKAIIQAKKSKKKVAVMMIDGHKLKQINDTYGHDAGDVAIKELGMRIESCIRNQDVVARMGGDEFAVIISDLDSEEMAVVIAERILNKLKKPFYYRKKRLTVNVGIGIAIYPDHGTEKSLLMSCADKALYKTKEDKDLGYFLYQPPKRSR